MAPLCVPSGIDSDSSPSSVGTFTLPPSAMVAKPSAQLAVQVVVLAPEHRMLRHVDDDVEIAGRSALGAVLAFAGQAQALARGDAGRNLDRELALCVTRPLPRHVGHGFVMIRPAPRHWPQVRATVKKPC